MLRAGCLHANATGSKLQCLQASSTAGCYSRRNISSIIGRAHQGTRSHVLQVSNRRKPSFRPNGLLGAAATRTYWWSSKSKPPEESGSSELRPPELAPAAAPTPIENPIADTTQPSFSPSISQSTAQPPSETLVDVAPTLDTGISSSIPFETFEPLANQAALALSTIPPSALGRFWLPIGGIQHIFIGFSSLFPSLPAWEVILAGSILIRAAASPWAIDQMRSSNKMTSIRPQMVPLQEEIRNAQNPQQKQIAALKLQKLFRDNDIRPMKMIGNVVITLVPSLFSFFAVRRFCTADPAIPGMVAGGTGSLGWIGDLTVADPTFVLPVIAFAGFQAQMTVLQWEQAVPDKSTWQAHMPNLLRVLMIITTPLFAYLPSGVFIYFLGTATWGIFQGLMLRIPAVRTFLKVPPKVVNAVKPPTFRETARKVKAWLTEKKNATTTGW